MHIYTITTLQNTAETDLLKIKITYLNTKGKKRMF